MKRLHFLVTAGPTREMLDPVRFLSNVSTGEMGYQVARAARKLGHRVTLISGPTHLKPPAGVRFISVLSASEMEREVKRFFPASDVLIMTAAVCDYTPVHRKKQKIRRISQKSVLFKRTRDILASVGRERRQDQFVVGFCLETQNLRQNAVRKLREKNMDLIVANSYGGSSNPFGKNDISVLLIDRALKTNWLRGYKKSRFAHYLTRFVEKKLPVQKG